MARRRWLAPEVVQTSAMDCGPATLKCLLEGFGVAVSYGRLREVCQTDVDGTSIDVLEEVAGQLGLEAEQVMLPLDHLLVPESRALPALLVVRLPSGFTHFVVVWRRCGDWLQIMDPAAGRRWIRGARLLEEVYVHTMTVPADGWREWAGSAEYRATLARRLADLGLADAAGPLLDEAAAAAGWRPLAALEASVHLLESLVRAGAARRGPRLQPLLRSVCTRAVEDRSTLPASYWSVEPAPCEEGEEEAVRFRGAVLIRVRGRRGADADATGESAPRNPELAAALGEPSPAPLREFLRLMRGDGVFRTGVLLGAAATAAATVALEALLLRGALSLGRSLGLFEQRLQAASFFLVFVFAILLIELGVVGRLARLGRRAEIRLRAAFFEKMPRLPDRYFASRPVSDLAERSHALHHLRLMPRVGGNVVRVAIQMLIVAAAVCWLYPGSALIALTAAAASIAIPLLLLPTLQEQDLRIRTHNGALSRFYLDAMLGVGAVRAHSATNSVRREHESLLVEWIRAGRERIRTLAAFEVVQSLAGVPFAVWLLAHHAATPQGAGDVMLLAYWALLLPTLGAELVFWARQYPVHRNVTLRLLEPLGAPEEPRHGASSAGAAAGSGESEDHAQDGAEQGNRFPRAGSRAAGPRGVRLDFGGVSVRAGGHTILEGVDVGIEPGSHVAIVGPSGAGKSSLVGLLLGVHGPSEGVVRVDGEALDASRLERLRNDTAWLDPSVQLWNRSLFDNLVYGAERLPTTGLVDILRRADLRPVLDRLPDGLQSPLGESGGFLSGGEGQRVRLGRAMSRWTARLVIMDEPFRGLDREQRGRMLRHSRELWAHATVICVTHDVSETLEFDRVLVVDGGRIVADGAPALLAAEPGSPYAALLAAEADAWEGTWSNPVWRRLRLDGGRLVEEARTPALLDGIRGGGL
jgi:ABC-type bacteriocin/lantibiotic exporter with double-glycine peptidase domain